MVGLNYNIQYEVILTPGQIRKIARAVANNFKINIRLKRAQLNNGQGQYTLLLSQQQNNKLNRVQNRNKGDDVKIARTNIQQSGSLLHWEQELCQKLSQWQQKLPKSDSRFGDRWFERIGEHGCGQKFGTRCSTGGFLIPQNKIDHLNAYKHLLSAKQ